MASLRFNFCVNGITELSLERAGPVIFRTFALELIAFRLIPAICPARRGIPESDWKRPLLPGKAYPTIKAEQISAISSWNRLWICYHLQRGNLKILLVKQSFRNCA